MRIKANNIRVSYEVKGSGSWLTFIHGPGENLDVWRSQVSTLSPLYQVLAYDVRGHGGTDTPQSDITLDVLAEDLFQLMKVLHAPRTHMIAHSTGGRIAIRLAQLHPEVVRTLILAHCNLTPPQRSEEETRELIAVGRKRIDLVERQGLGAIVDESTSALLRPEFRQNNPSAYERYRWLCLRNNPDSYVVVMKAMLPTGRPPDVSGLSCPMLLIAGSHDQADVAAARAAQELLPWAKVVALPTGKVSMIEDPEEFTKAVLRFLSELPYRPAGEQAAARGR